MCVLQEGHDDWQLSNGKSDTVEINLEPKMIFNFSGSTCHLSCHINIRSMPLSRWLGRTCLNQQNVNLKNE